MVSLKKEKNYVTVLRIGSANVRLAEKTRKED